MSFVAFRLASSAYGRGCSPLLSVGRLEHWLQIGAAVLALVSCALPESVGAALAPGWASADLGEPALAGSSYWTNGVWTVSGGGADVCNSDQLQFAWAPMNGDGTVQAQVLSVLGESSAQAGVMIRADTSLGGIEAAVLATASNGITFQWRSTAGSSCSFQVPVGANSLAMPVWLQLTRAGNSFSAYWSPDLLTWTQIGSTQSVPMSSNCLAGLGVCAGDNATLATATFSGVALPQPSFGVYRELWTGLSPIPGNSLAALTNTTYNPNWPNHPNTNYTAIYPGFETETNTALNYYGQRLRTFVIPPLDGNYTFWIASADTSELWLSVDETSANAAPACWVSDATSPRQWTLETNQQSALIPLQAGHRYYLEARMQHSRGNDNLAVGWQLPTGAYEQPLVALSPAGTRLVPYSGVDLMPGIYGQPTNLVAADGGPAVFSVLVTNPAPVTYQWQVNGTNLAEAIAASPVYRIGRADPNHDSGQSYTCVISNSVGAVTSSAALLTVIANTTPPTVVSARYIGPTQVQLVFSEPLDPSGATNPVNYIFTNGIAVDSVSLNPGGASAVLTTAPLVYGSNYVLVLNGLQDLAFTPNSMATNTTVSFVAALFLPAGIGLPSPAGSISAVTGGFQVAGGGGGDIGGSGDRFEFASELWSGDFDLKVRLASLSQTDPFAKAGLMARASLGAASPFAAVLATPSMNGTFFEARLSGGASTAATGKAPVNYPQGWLRLKRVGSQFTGFASLDGLAWQQLGTATLALPDPIYLGMAVSSHNPGQLALAQFMELSPATNATTGLVAPPHEPLGPCSRRTPLVFSEIMYKPAPRADSNNVEYVEIYNTNPWFQDLSGYQIIADNLSYAFPPGTVLAGGAFLVVAASPSSIQNVYGITNVVGPYMGSLKKSGTLQLLDGQGAILLEVPYSNLYPWPVAADGTGHSLVLANPTYGEAQPRAWAISDAVGGSPGMADAYRPSPLRNVVINELLAHSESSNVLQFIELYNHSSQTIDLSGCTLTDDPANQKFVLPAGTTIGPGGFLAFDQTQLGFQLNGAGGTVYFINPNLSRVLDAVPFEAQADGISLGRWPDGANTFYPLAARTPNAGNSPVWMGDIVINELMYDPISGNDDDQYIELYNRGTNAVSLAHWQLLSGPSLIFPPGTALAPDSYLVLGRNVANLMAKYTNLSTANTLGNYTGKLSHKGQRVVLARPETLTGLTAGKPATNTIFVTEDEVTYEAGGRWGQWAHGGGSSLELINPNTNHRLAYNWGDSDETLKSSWTNLEYTGVLDNGANYASTIDVVQVGILDVGECLVDDLEVRPGGATGANIIANSGFETGLAGWTPYGDHVRSSLETASGLGGYQSSQSLHLRATDGIWTMGDYVQAPLTQTTLASGQTATLRLKARWLRGWPEVLMRLHGNWLEVTGAMPVPTNLGTPGQRNSRYVANPGPAIYEVSHSPPLPAAGQPVVVTARFHDLTPFQATLRYRIDAGYNSAPTYFAVPMLDTGVGGDALAGDGVFSATIPGQTAGRVVAFLVQATDTNNATTVFPADLKNNAIVPRECVVGFGDTIPTTSFSHHHVFITQNWAQRWANGGGVSHEVYDGTWVDGGGRVIYDWSGRYAGSPYHQNLGSPVTTVGGMHWIVPDDDPLLGVTSLNKQHVPGNGPLDDDTIQREQTCYWMAQQIGLGGQNRRYYVYYVNGVRHAPLMEDAQVPDADMLKEYFPNDNSGTLIKNHSWFEGDVAPLSDAYLNFINESWCVLGNFTTTLNGVPNQLKPERYRWMWWLRQWIGSANNFSDVFGLIRAANLPVNNPAYYAQMEALVDTEEWMRFSAIEHASGDWDSFFTQNQWNMYNYKPTHGKWTAMKWDWNISLGGGTTTWGPDGSQLFNAGSYDSVMAAFQSYPAYRRAYLRALQDIANLAMNNAKVNPLLNAKYAAFQENGLTTTSYGIVVNSPTALETWIGTMHNSLLAAVAAQGVNGVSFAVNSVVVTGNVATISGTAPLGVKTVEFNGVFWPVTWPSVTGWTAKVPLEPGTNVLNVAGVDLHGQPVSGATASTTAIFTGPPTSPVGQVVINEIMAQPAIPGAQFVELYNASTNSPFDLSGWQLPELAYTFPSGSFIGPNGFVLLGADRTRFSQAYGATIPLWDVYPGSLPATGGILSLLQPGAGGTNSQVVTRVRYGSSAPWPTNAIGGGSSLQLIDPRQDNWRVGNWAVVQTNTSVAPAQQWQYVMVTGAATRPILLICMHGAVGDAYVDDVKLVAGSVPEVGANLITDGGFESPLSGPWTVSANLANSTITTAVSHSGSSSLHVVATGYGDAIANAIWENTAAIVTNGTYTLSYWYLPGASGNQLLVRLSGSSPASGQVYSLANLEISPPTVLTGTTPGATNSVFATLPAFPPLWLNEVEPFHLDGITNGAGQPAPWLEIYNPTTNTVSLGGLFLANNYTNLAQWAFPANALINAGQFKVIFADGATNLSTTNELHTSFILDPGTGSLALSRVYQAQAQVLDYLDYTNLAPGTAYGSFPDGQSFARQQLFFPTPGGTNDASIPVSFIPYTASGAVYTQDFNSLPNPGPTSVDSGNPVTINGITYSLSNPFDFAAPSTPTGQSGGLGLADLSGWYGLADATASVGTRLGASDGDQTAGGVISFGPPAGANRALGLLATSTTGFTAFGAKFVNLTTNILRQISVQFTGEVWRQSDKAKTLAVSYYLDPTGTRPFSTNVTSALAALNVSFPTLATDVGGAAVDGTLPANQIGIGITQQPILDWPPGAALWLMWEMQDPAGKAQGLAIDDFSFSASSDPASNLALVVIAPGDQWVYLGQTLSLTIQASDPLAHPQPLIFSLDPGAPANATINPSTGLLIWTPTASQTPSTNSVTVRATDGGVPAMSGSQTFNLIAVKPPSLSVLTSGSSKLILNLPGLPGKTYRVQVTDDLSIANWSAVGPDVAGNGGTISVVVDASVAVQRFYRVLVVE